jgi:hypothetical protein
LAAWPCLLQRSKTWHQAPTCNAKKTVRQSREQSTAADLGTRVRVRDEPVLRSPVPEMKRLARANQRRRRTTIRIDGEVGEEGLT